MPGELLLGVAGKIALQKIIEEAIKQGSPPVIAGLRETIRDWRKTPHPSLKSLRTICDWLEPFRHRAEGGSVGGGPGGLIDLSAPSSKYFRRHDMSIDEISELWFRTETNLWKDKIKPIKKKWETLSALASPDRVHYFRGTDINFDYGAIKKPKTSQHPIFRSVHPFIMISQVPRTKLGENPIAEAIEFFVDGWEAFVVENYTKFQAGTAIKLDSQAYVEGYFNIAPEGLCRINNETVGAEVTLWRCMLVTASANSIEIMNVGIPASTSQGGEYLGHFHSWMKNFRKLSMS